MPLVTVILAFLGKWVTFTVGKYLAQRALLIAVVMGLGPIVIYKGLGLMLRFAGTYGSGLVSSLMSQVNVDAQVVGLWGVGAYLGQLLKIQEGIAIYLSFLILKFTWSLMPKFGVPIGLTR